MARKPKHYLLTETAEHDFRQARQWSSKRWGKELTRQYFQDLHECAESIANEFQRLPETDLATGISGLSIYPVREHYLV